MDSNYIVEALRKMDKPDMVYGYDGAYKWYSERIGPDAADLIESLQAQLTRKCEHERRAVKCICDVETYLQLGSAKYIRKTIDEWRESVAEELKIQTEQEAVHEK